MVEDQGFKKLMKTGRPEYYLPSRVTVARDVKHVFKKARKCIAKMLQVEFSPWQKNAHCKFYQNHEGTLSFGTDAWTSPNSKAYVALTVHFEQDGVPISLLLDIVEVASSHSGANLASAFAQVLEDFGIADKVSYAYRTKNLNYSPLDFLRYSV